MAIAEKIYFDQIENNGTYIFTRQDNDYQASAIMHDNWKQANQECVKVLNREVKEAERLIIHRGLVVQMTTNHNNGLYSNNQMAYIKKYSYSNRNRFLGPHNIIFSSLWC